MKREHLAWIVPAAAVMLAAGILIGRASAALIWPLLMLACAAGACLVRCGMITLLALMTAIGSVLGWAAYHPALPPEGECLASGVVTDLRLREDGQVSTMLCGVTLNGAPLGSGAYWSFYLDEDEPLPPGIAPGMRVTVTAKVYHPDGVENPDGFNYREYLLQRGATVGLYGAEGVYAQRSWHPLGLAAAARDALARRLCAVMGEEAGGFAATMLLGSRDLLSDTDREAFSHLGISHILSVSGFHVGLLTGLFVALVRPLHLARTTRAKCIAVLLGLYTLLTGLNAPVVRATLLILLGEYGALKHRQRSGLHLLCASWIIQLVLSPVQLTGVGFQLTYSAVLGLVLVTPWLRSLWEPRRGAKLWRYFCSGVGAQVGTLLPVLYWFHELPLLGLVINVAVIPVAAGLMYLCWLTLATLPVQPLAAALGWLTARLLDGMLNVVHLLTVWEGVTLWTARGGVITLAGWALLMLGMSWWCPRGRRAAAIVLGAALTVISVVPIPVNGVRYIQFSVGNADSAILHDSGLCVAIDTGEDGRVLAEYLHQRRLKLDALVLTHLHRDHAGGVAALLDQRIPVARCYLPVNALHSEIDEAMPELLLRLEASGTELVYLARGDEITLPSGSVTVLWPERGRVRSGQNANCYSMALLAELNGSAMLLTGDLMGAYELYAAAPADILKLAHHGSEGSTSAEFLRAVSPGALLLSCGSDERSEQWEMRRNGIPLMNTHRDGAVIIDFDMHGCTVTTVK